MVQVLFHLVDSASYANRSISVCPAFCWCRHLNTPFEVSIRAMDSRREQIREMGPEVCTLLPHERTELATPMLSPQANFLGGTSGNVYIKIFEHN